MNWEKEENIDETKNGKEITRYLERTPGSWDMPLCELGFVGEFIHYPGPRPSQFTKYILVTE